MSVEDNFDEYLKEVLDLFSEEFFQNNHDWVMESDTMVCWSLSLHNKRIPPIKAVKIIEKAYERYAKQLETYNEKVKLV